MKVWTITSSKGYITGVYFDKDNAIRAKGYNEVIEEWEPEITDGVAKIIKTLAQELR